MTYTNLGTYDSIEAVWAAYPEGGSEGDYVLIGTGTNLVRHDWNKYDMIWENQAVVTNHFAYGHTDFDGDVNVSRNLTVGGTFRAHRVKQLECGLFSTIAMLTAAYPHPEVGMWAYVGGQDGVEEYLCEAAGIWTATGNTADLDDILLQDYCKKEDQGISSSDGDKTIAVTIEGTTKNVIGSTAGSVTSSHIADGAVTSGKIASAAITAGMIQDNAVGTAKINDGAVTSAKISSELQATINGKLDSSDIDVSSNASGSILFINKQGTEHTAVGTANGSVGTSLLAQGAVTTAKIADGAISEDKIADGQIYNQHLTESCVETANIEDKAVTPEKLSARYFSVAEMLPLFFSVVATGTATLYQDGSSYISGPASISLSNGQILAVTKASASLQLVAYGVVVDSADDIVVYKANSATSVGIVSSVGTGVTYTIYE